MGCDNMDIVKREFKSVFKDAMQEIGFTYAGYTFYRHINDVLQTLTLRSYRGFMTIHYGIFPLCLPITDALPCSFYMIVDRDKDGQPKPFTCVYDTKNAQEIQKGIKRGFKAFWQDTASIFQSGTDTTTACTAMIESRQKLGGSVLLHDISLKWMYLQNGNYDEAYFYQAALIALNMNLIRNSTTKDDFSAPEMRKQVETFRDDDSPYLTEQRRLLHRIIQRDDAYFQELIEKNTQITLEFLHRVKKSPCKYGSGRY